MSDSLLKFSEEVRSLYFKTGIKDIEDSYLSILASYSGDVTDQEIVKWINGLSNSGVDDPKVEKALKILPTINEDQLMNKWNDWLLENVNFPSQFKKPKKNFDYPADYIGYFILFGKLLGNPNAGLLLRPFENIIRFFGSPKVSEQIEGIEEPSEFIVYESLRSLQDQFLDSRTAPSQEGNKASVMSDDMYDRLTKQEKKRYLYDYLYDRFSEDFASGASSMGYNDLAKQFEQGSLLGNVAALEEYINNTGLRDEIYVSEPNPLYMQLLDKIVKFVTKPANLNRYIKNPKNFEEAYHEIKEFIMRIVGYASNAEISRVRTERNKYKTIPSRSKAEYYGAPSAPDKPMEINVPNEAWTSGKVISLISTILAELSLKFNL